MYPYQNKELTVKERVTDLLGRMTLKQKIAQLQCVMIFGRKPSEDEFPDGVGEMALTLYGMSMEEHAKALREASKQIAEKALGIPPILHIEAVTGLTANEKCTVFPSAIGLGATFDPDIVGEAAKVIHDQTKTMGYYQTLSPVLDVCRDPRWGRIGETYGEDPTLNAMLGTSYVKNLQGKPGEMLAATGKHFLGYGFSSGGLNMATCAASMTEIREVHAKPFQAAITEGGLLSVMNSYGTIDGDMVIGSKRIMTDLLRDEMEFDGIMVSDYTSIEHLVDHRICKDIKEAGVKALEAGLDVECPNPNGFSTENLLAGVESGAVSEEWIDRAVSRVLDVKIRLGMLDAKDEERNFECFTSKESRMTSLKAARESIVLLKNDGILPLKKEKSKIAVIGPHADNIRLLFGCYTFVSGLDMMIGGSMADQAGMENADVSALAESSMGVKKDAEKYPGSDVECDSKEALAVVAGAYPDTKTILQSLKEKAPETDIRYARGCDIAGTDQSGFEEAKRLAEDSDVVILTIGGKYGWGGSCTIGEGIDSDTIGLTGVQEELALTLMETGTPVVIAHMDARPLCSPAISEKANAILEVWFPGTTGGEAFADVIFGDYNPAGRLSSTVPRSVGQIPIYSGQYMGNSYYSKEAETNACRYVDSTTSPLYPFGYGLSYTRFSYSNLMMDRETVSSDGEITISCKVKNTGSMDGDEVVQLYVSDLLASKLRPYKEFAGCKRVRLAAGEEKTVCFTVRADQFAFIGKDDKWIVEEGDMQVMIGSSSDDLPLCEKFHIEDTAYIRPAKRGFFAKAYIGK